jgi:hypothetical protein
LRLAYVGLILVAPPLFSENDSQTSAIRDFPQACEVVRQDAGVYFSAHGFSVNIGGNGQVSLYRGKGAGVREASGRFLRLNRFAIPKYIREGQLSPFRIYSEFALFGTLVLAGQSQGCRVTLSFLFTTYEWSPFLIIDGTGLHLDSNGRLEHSYLDAIPDRLTKPE